MKCMLSLGKEKGKERGRKEGKGNIVLL